MRDPIKYSDALKEAIIQLLDSDSRVLLLGLGVQQGTGGISKDATQKYPGRVLDTPTSEAALTGLAVGAADCVPLYIMTASSSVCSRPTNCLRRRPSGAICSAGKAARRQ